MHFLQYAFSSLHSKAHSICHSSLRGNDTNTVWICPSVLFVKISQNVMFAIEGWERAPGSSVQHDRSRRWWPRQGRFAVQEPTAPLGEREAEDDRPDRRGKQRSGHDSTGSRTVALGQTDPDHSQPGRTRRAAARAAGHDATKWWFVNDTGTALVEAPNVAELWKGRDIAKCKPNRHKGAASTICKSNHNSTKSCPHFWTCWAAALIKGQLQSASWRGDSSSSLLHFLFVALMSAHINFKRLLIFSVWLVFARNPRPVSHKSIVHQILIDTIVRHVRVPSFSAECISPEQLCKACKIPYHQTRILKSKSVPVVFMPKMACGRLRWYLCLAVKGIVSPRMHNKAWNSDLEFQNFGFQIKLRFFDQCHQTIHVWWSGCKILVQVHSTSRGKQELLSSHIERIVFRMLNGKFYWKLGSHFSIDI